jgi:hypothetical protein
VLPKTDDPKISDLAGRVQIRLDRLAAKTGKKVDRRPAPERVCPKDAGCKGVSLGAILAVKEQGCAGRRPRRPERDAAGDAGAARRRCEAVRDHLAVP